MSPLSCFRWIPVLLCLAPAMSADAGTWRVGRLPTDCPDGCHFFDDEAGDGTGIEQAMTSPGVVLGDTVRVWPGGLPGGYKRFEMKSGVVLLSDAGPDSTLICGSANFEPAISFVATSPSTVVEGFTIKWNSTATGLGGAVGCFAASGVVRNCIIRDCYAGSGSGVYQAVSDVLIENNLFLNNECVGGAGVIAITGGNPTVRNNTFFASVAPFGASATVLYASGAAYTFDRNVVAGSRGAPAVYCAGTTSPTVTCNLFWENELGPFSGDCVDSIGTSGNLAADPLFCDPLFTPLPACHLVPAGTDLNDGDYRFGVCEDSPALGSACGPLGYASPGGNCAPCRSTSVATIEVSSWGAIKARYRP